MLTLQKDIDSELTVSNVLSSAILEFQDSILQICLESAQDGHSGLETTTLITFEKIISDIISKCDKSGLYSNDIKETQKRISSIMEHNKNIQIYLSTIKKNAESQ